MIADVASGQAVEDGHRVCGIGRPDCIARPRRLQLDQRRPVRSRTVIVSSIPSGAASFAARHAPLSPISMSSLQSGSRTTARRKWLLAAAPALLFVACVSADRISGLKPHDNAAFDIGTSDFGVVISQVYGGGGN